MKNADPSKLSPLQPPYRQRLTDPILATPHFKTQKNPSATYVLKSHPSKPGLPQLVAVTFEKKPSSYEEACLLRQPQPPAPLTPDTFTTMPYDETLATQLRQLLGRRKNLTEKNVAEKKLFGGLGFLLSGNICCGAWKEFLILRLGEDAARQVLGEEHTRPFDITGKPMRGWAMVEPAGWQDTTKLRRWVAWAVEFTNDLPPK